MLYLVEKVRIAPDRQIAAHTQQSFELSYIVKGSGERILGGKAEAFSAGEVVLLPPGITHQWVFDPADVDGDGCIENITFFFSRVFLEHLSESFPTLSPCILRLQETAEAVLFRGDTRERLAAHLEEMSRPDEWERIPHILSVLRLISETEDTVPLSRPGRGRSPQQRMEKVQVYLSCNYYRKVSLEELSAYAGMNRTAFCKYFKQMTGKTYVQWLTDFRLEKAREMLSQKEFSVSEIAGACGFESLPHFTRTFTRRTGASPSEFRAAR